MAMNLADVVGGLFYETDPRHDTERAAHLFRVMPEYGPNLYTLLQLLMIAAKPVIRGGLVGAAAGAGLAASAGQDPLPYALMSGYIGMIIDCAVYLYRIWPGRLDLAR